MLLIGAMMGECNDWLLMKRCVMIVTGRSLYGYVLWPISMMNWSMLMRRLIFLRRFLRESYNFCFKIRSEQTSPFNNTRAIDSIESMALLSFMPLPAATRSCIPLMSGSAPHQKVLLLGTPSWVTACCNETCGSIPSLYQQPSRVGVL